MKKIQHISNSEMQIMEYIWKTGRAVTTAEVMQNLPEGIEWSLKTVVTFLSRLIDKGVLKSARVGRAFHYQPCVTEQEYRNFETKQFISNVHKGSVLGFISALCDNGDLTREDIEEIEKILKKV
ncbi:BlaI/MecI/CopY family transcriptional regulator [Desulfoscipio gibsoniae]